MNEEKVVVKKQPVCVTLRMKYSHRVKQMKALFISGYEMEDIYIDTETSKHIAEIWGRVDYKNLKDLRRLNEVNMVTEETELFAGYNKNKVPPGAEVTEQPETEEPTPVE